jgi:hypothetical protein
LLVYLPIINLLLQTVVHNKAIHKAWLLLPIPKHNKK